MTTVAADRNRRGLAQMLGARRVAVIGASERNPFSAPVIHNFGVLGYSGEVVLVNPRGEPVGGRPTLRRAAELDAGIDAAFVCVPLAAVHDVVAEAADAGVRNFIVVASGFAETGPDGARRQQALADLAHQRDLVLLGPNSLGYISYAARVPLCVLTPNAARGSLGIVSASGSVGSYITKVANLQGVGLSHVVLLGNEASFCAADALDMLVDDPETRSIAVFVEAVYEPERFARAAERALRARKPIVMLKPGSAENTARLAAAHTGALVGDDRVFAAAAREMGVCRVESYEDVIATAMLLQQTGPVAKPGVAALTISGGSGEVVSDLAGRAGVDFPAFTGAAKEALDSIVSAFGAAENPLDLTGAALSDVSLWERTLTAIAQDERIGLALCIWDVPFEGQPPWMAEMLKSMVRGYGAFPVIPPLVATVVEPVTAHGRTVIAEVGLPGIIPGLKPAVAALAQLAAWSRRALDPRPVRLFGGPAQPRPAARPAGERALLDWLSSRGVPVTPGCLAGDAEAAVAAAGRHGYPVALKLASPDAPHKSDIGGVALNVGDAAAVRRAFATVAAARDGMRVEGAIVSPMRDHTVELVVSISRDPTWGPVLAVGLGGLWVEVIGDSALVPLPASAQQVLAALTGLKAAALLQGARGRPAVDLDRLAATILGIADAALALGPDLAALEINPLAVWPDRAEAMDALALWVAGAQG